MDENFQNENNPNDPRNPMGEEEIALRRNQVLMFGVILLGILAICLAVSMPSDLEFQPSIPSDDMGPTGGGDDSGMPSIMMKNLTNSTRKSFFKNPEDSVENKILRNIAIQKAIKGIDNNGKLISLESSDELNNNHQENEEIKKLRVDQIVQSFVNSVDFEDFIIDIEINDAIKKLRKEKGYRKRDNTIFDDLFKQIEKQFLGDDPDEVQLIRRVGEELEKRAREIIIERKKIRGEDATYEEELIASELYMDYEKYDTDDHSSQQSSGLQKDDVEQEKNKR